jgi:hypothetical protein
VGGANPQAGFGFLVQLPNCECGHASNDSIAGIGCKEALAELDARLRASSAVLASAL